MLYMMGKAKVESGRWALGCGAWVRVALYQYRVMLSPLSNQITKVKPR